MHQSQLPFSVLPRSPRALTREMTVAKRKRSSYVRMLQDLWEAELHSLLVGHHSLREARRSHPERQRHDVLDMISKRCIVEGRY